MSLEESPNLSSIGHDVSSLLEPQYRIKILSITVVPGDDSITIRRLQNCGWKKNGREVLSVLRRFYPV